jgi:hypothetical protein
LSSTFPDHFSIQINLIENMPEHNQNRSDERAEGEEQGHNEPDHRHEPAGQQRGRTALRTVSTMVFRSSASPLRARRAALREWR